MNALLSFIMATKNNSQKISKSMLEDFFSLDVVKAVLEHKGFEQAVFDVIRKGSNIKEGLVKEIQAWLHRVDIPTQADIEGLKKKISNLEKQLDQSASKDIAIKTLKKPVKMAVNAKSTKAKASQIKAPKAKAKIKKAVAKKTKAKAKKK